jgi:hypothetical protein
VWHLAGLSAGRDFDSAAGSCSGFTKAGCGSFALAVRGASGGHRRLGTETFVYEHG